jgi:3-deoxy-7-phosphoheptulonate synthase
MIEVHIHPNAALSDGAQSLKPERFSRLMIQLRAIAEALGRSMADTPKPESEPVQVEIN